MAPLTNEKVVLRAIELLSRYSVRWMMMQELHRWFGVLLLDELKDVKSNYSNKIWLMYGIVLGVGSNCIQLDVMDVKEHIISEAYDFKLIATD